MLSGDDNERLTRTGAGTPMGTFFRRFWIPALLSQELPEPAGPPVRVRVMGEDQLPSATPRGGRACSSRGARTAGPTSSSAATRSAGCAAPITAGSST